MKHAKSIFMILIMMLLCCSCSTGQLSSGKVGTIPLGSINKGVNFNPFGGASVWAPHEFVCNSMSACGIYDPAQANDGATVCFEGVSRVKIDLFLNKVTDVRNKQDMGPNLNDWPLPG